MNSITTYLLDDEVLANNRLTRLLRLYADINIVGKNICPTIAIEEIATLSPDIVFVDVEMPKLSGFEVIKQLQNIGIQSKFIFVTGYDQYAIKAIRNEAFDFLVKPIDVDDLSDAIKRYRSKNDTIIFPKGWGLSSREEEILQLIVKGKTSKQIAKELFLSKHTIDAHRKHILEKSGYETTSQVLGAISLDGYH